MIESSPPGWTYATIPAGLLIFLIFRAVFRKAIVTPAWPFCDRCRRRRAIAIAIASAIVASGLATIVIGFRLSYSDDAEKMFGLGLVIALLGYVGFHWARPVVIAGAKLTQDGLYVALRRAHPAFVVQLGKAEQAELARHHASTPN